MPLNTLEDALHHELRDLLSAEKQFRDGCKKLAKNAVNEELKAAFEEHREVTEVQIERLNKAFVALGKTPRSEKCEAAAGLVEEANGIFEKDAADDVKDALLIAAAQKVEHYEIASYGTVCTWAKLLGKQDVFMLMKETLAEEKETDEKLTQIAERINQAAEEPVGAR